eukprot:91953_1
MATSTINEEQVDNKEDIITESKDSTPPHGANIKQKQVNFGAFHEDMKNLLYWKDPFFTASCLGLCIITWLLLVIMNRSVLSIFSFCIVFTLIACMVYMNLLFVYTEFTAKSSIPKEFKMPNASFDCMDEETAQYIVTNLRLWINSSYYCVSYIITCQSNKHTLIAIFIAIACIYIGESLSGITLCTLLLIVLFTIPYLYNKNYVYIQTHSYPVAMIALILTLFVQIPKLKQWVYKMLGRKRRRKVQKKRE